MTNRRAFLGQTLAITGATTLGFGQEAGGHGTITGNAAGNAAGLKILADGGNAVDAVVGASFVAATVSMHMCGIGGYGGHLCFGDASTGKVSAVDFNSTAPRGFDPNDKVPEFGWNSAGVPGFLAGMQTAIERFGTMEFRDVLQPALALARDGFPLHGGVAGLMNRILTQADADEGFRRIATANGNQVKAGSTFVRKQLAAMLEGFAEANSTASFYRGEGAKVVAAAFARKGGHVTVEDMADYEALVVEPSTVEWNGWHIHTAPLTAGGLTSLQMLNAAKALDLKAIDPAKQAFAMVEAMRICWTDRLTLLGDPAHAGNDIPVTRLLSAKYAEATAERVRAALRDGKPITHTVEAKDQPGTVSLSAVDRKGNLAAMTITHGRGFGARVGVSELGIILGHGNSRFVGAAGTPNAIAPGKRPLNNMCPTIITREGKPRFALGGAGGRKIPNALFEVLRRLCGDNATLAEAMAAPRLHTEGPLGLRAEKTLPEKEVARLKQLGYKVSIGNSATISAVGFDPSTGKHTAIFR